jgi:serine/threonine-protein kinase ATR
MVDYPNEIDEICMTLVTSNMLGRYVPDLFFIEKTSFSDRLKKAILSRIESQKIETTKDFTHNIHRLLRHLESEASDSDVKVYCLKYLQDIVIKYRKDFNDLIFTHPDIDSSMHQLLSLLIWCAKNTQNQALQQQAAICFGEISAIHPTILKHKFQNHKTIITTIHSNAFAIEMLRILSIYFKDIRETRLMDSLSVAVQNILKDRRVQPNNDDAIWNSLQETTKKLFKPLLTSYYVPKVTTKVVFDSIFLKQAQTATDWAYLLSIALIQKIDANETKELLSGIILSMREIEEILTFVLPFVVLHFLQSPSSEKVFKFLTDEFKLVFKVALNEQSFMEVSEENDSTYCGSFDYTPLQPVEDMNSENEDKLGLVTSKIIKLIFEIWDRLTEFSYNCADKTLPILKRIQQLKNSFDTKHLAEVCFKCAEYERALVFYEKYLTSLNEEDRANELRFLIKIYTKLREPDLVEGLKAVQLRWSAVDKVYIADVTENLDEAFSGIQQMMKGDSIDTDQIKSIVSCYTQSNQIINALHHSEVLLKRLYETNNDAFYDEVKAEPLWRLSRFDELEKLYDDDKNFFNPKCWSMLCGKLILKFRSDDVEGFNEELEKTRIRVISTFKIYDSDSTTYTNNYEEIIHLHMLTEFEKIFSTLNTLKNQSSYTQSQKALNDLFKTLNMRRILIQPTTSILESCTSIQRTLLSIVKTKLNDFVQNETHREGLNKLIDGEIGRTWLDCAKTACQHKLMIQANAYMSEAEIYNLKEIFVEQSKLYWLKGDDKFALKILNTGIDSLEKSLNKLTTDEKRLLSRAYLDLAEYNDLKKNNPFEVHLGYYQTALKYDEENEKVNIVVANYMDKHYFHSGKKLRTKILPNNETYRILVAYGNVLKNGSTYVLQAMPRILQIWADTLEASHYNPTRTEASIKSAEAFDKVVNDLADKLKPHQFYTAFSQIMSILCHPAESVFRILKKIIMKLIKNYPMQACWFIIYGIRTKNIERIKRTQIILELSRNEDLKNFQIFVQCLKDLSDSINEGPAFIDKCVASVNRLLKKTKILMPLLKNFQLLDASCEYIYDLVHMTSMDKDVRIISSLQRPKQIKFNGSDGNSYAELLKAKDDLRVDYRVMEFINVVNDLCRKDFEASQRNIRARTYCVLPLGEEFGIIGEMIIKI